MTTLFLLWFAGCGMQYLLAGDGVKSPEPRIVRQSFLASGDNKTGSEPECNRIDTRYNLGWWVPTAVNQKKARAHE